MIDLRSDTLTRPTEEMRNAMRDAEVGDDYYSEDPTVIRLEELAAEKLGKEAALFVTSGTLGNIVSICTLTRRGDVVIAETDAHIIRSERGQLGAIAGVQPKTVDGKLGVLMPEAIEDALAVFPEETCHPRPSLICIENTHNAAGGTCYSRNHMQDIRSIADRHNMRVLVDGARIFNAAIAQRVEPRELAEGAEVLTFCLSKGLCCPYGSLIVASRDIIQETRNIRQMLGGGMRQAGIMAAAGIVGLERMVSRLEEDHENARLLAEQLLDLGFAIDMETVQTNMVIVTGSPPGISMDEWVEGLRRENVVVGSANRGRLRLVTHYTISRADILAVIGITSKIVRSG